MLVSSVDYARLQASSSDSHEPPVTSQKMFEEYLATLEVRLNQILHKLQDLKTQRKQCCGCMNDSFVRRSIRDLREEYFVLLREVNGDFPSSYSIKCNLISQEFDALSEEGIEGTRLNAKQRCCALIAIAVVATALFLVIYLAHPPVQY